MFTLIAMLALLTPSHLTKTSQPVREEIVEFGICQVETGSVPIRFETNSAVWYELLPDNQNVFWIQSPGVLTSPPPQHCLMGVKYDPVGTEEIKFETHHNGLLAVIPSRDRRP